MPERKTVMISSTARDLPEHRKEALDACLRQGMFPVMMEHLPASDDEAISASLAMVDAADIYVGIFAHRYGYVPAGHAISVTEMEYNRAVERKIPRLIFVMDKDHPITIDQVELGEGAAKLEAFKKRLLAGNIVNFFKSPADLRAQVINSLSQQREPDLATFHYVSDIPAPPEAYIAHPYTLLQTHRLIGRQAELNLLTDWVASKTFEVSETSKVSIFNIVAIGGMGKSALTWKWFNEIAPQEMRPLAGRMWWSFYESDATFENFVIRALAYVTGDGREGSDRAPGLERSELRRSLTEHFNREELRTLCFDLGIEDEDLPDTLNGMARELVETCERRGRLPELIETVRRLRPDAAPIASDPLSQRLHEIRQIPQAEREARLLAALDHAPFLLVLDGLERILIAYARWTRRGSTMAKRQSRRISGRRLIPTSASFLKKLAQVQRLAHLGQYATLSRRT